MAETPWHYEQRYPADTVWYGSDRGHGDTGSLIQGDLDTFLGQPFTGNQLEVPHTFASSQIASNIKPRTSLWRQPHEGPHYSPDYHYRAPIAATHEVYEAPTIPSNNYHHHPADLFATLPTPAATMVRSGNTGLTSVAEGSASSTMSHDPRLQKSHESNLSANNMLDLTRLELNLTLGVEGKPYSYAQLITYAIAHSPHQKLTLAEIYDWCLTNFPYFRQQTNQGWKNSIRHNLSLNRTFVKVPRPINEPGKGAYWALDSQTILAGPITTSQSRNRQRSQSALEPLTGRSLLREDRALSDRELDMAHAAGHGMQRSKHHSLANSPISVTTQPAFPMLTNVDEAWHAHQVPEGQRSALHQVENAAPDKSSSQNMQGIVLSPPTSMLHDNTVWYGV